MSLFEVNLWRECEFLKGLAPLKMWMPNWSGFPKVQKLSVLILKDPKKFGYPKQKLDCVFIGRVALLQSKFNKEESLVPW